MGDSLSHLDDLLFMDYEKAFGAKLITEKNLE